MELNRFKQLLESTMGNVRPLISEDMDMDSMVSSPAGNSCTSLKICQGKTFKANSLDRLTDLYVYIYELNISNTGFKQVSTGGKDNIYPPAPAPTDSPYNPGTKVSWVFKNPKNSILDVYVWQRNECIKSCPQIYLSYNGVFEQYSILDDNDFNRLKSNLKKYYTESVSAM
jgi:hypothetical protein